MSFEHAIVWQVFPLGFVGAEPARIEGPVHHRLDALIPWLDYAQQLGCNVLQLGPIFDAETHGYDTRDHFRIDARLGDDDAFDRLIAAARARGIGVVLDGVFNHVGRRFGPFVAADEHADDAAARWFVREEHGWKNFEGHDALVAFNHAHHDVIEHVVAAMIHWLDRGAIGWRLDAAYAVPREFWRTVASRVREKHPQAILIGEVLHGPYAEFVDDSGLDTVTQYELWKAVWSSLKDKNYWELDAALKRHNDLLERFTPLTFVGNHDVTRLASQLDDSRHFAHAIVVLFTVGGHPSIYAGDEQGFVGVKEHRAGGDDAIRPAFPKTPAELAPFGAPHFELHQRLIGLRRRHPWLVRARTVIEKLENKAFAYRVSDPADDGRWLRVRLNISDDVVDFGAADGVVFEHGGDVVDGRVAAHGWSVSGPAV